MENELFERIMQGAVDKVMITKDKRESPRLQSWDESASILPQKSAEKRRLKSR